MTTIEELINSFDKIEQLFIQGKINAVNKLIEDYLEFFPLDDETLTTLGVILFEQKCFDKAIEIFSKAVIINDQCPTYLTNLGAALKEVGRLQEAKMYFESALEIDDKHFNASYNIANTYQKLGESTLSEKWYKYTLLLDPKYAPALNNLGTLYKSHGKIHEAIDYFRQAIALDPNNSIIASNYLFCLNYIPMNKKEVFNLHAAFGKFFSKHSPSSFPISSFYKRQLNVGYVSPDFRRHSVAHFIYPILHGHTYKVKVFCYSDTKKEDEVTKSLQSVSDYWRNTSLLSDLEMFDLIKNDKIDILVDLAGHSGGNRLTLFSMKPSKVQASYLGYPNTTGLKEIDYKLTDAIVDLIESDEYYSEKLCRMSNFLCYNPLFKTPDVSEPPCVKNKFLTFGSFNNRAKINDSVVETWSFLLKSIPNSKLVLKSSIELDKYSKSQLLKCFIEKGIDSNRITILPYLSITEHFEAYNLIDVSLDTFPYNGTTTTLESLWMGVPVIALEGDRHASRMGESILSKVDLTDWIVPFLINGYIGIYHLLNIENLIYLRNTLRDRLYNSYLMNEALFIEELEQNYFKMMN